jgi:DNA repair protein RecO (recombination protein O)
MHWTDDALVIGTRPHGESAVVAELMTRQHGRHLGLVHGGRSRRLTPVLQSGNSVRATWRARLDEQLGSFTVEVQVSRAARLIASSFALSGLAVLGQHMRLLPERDPHPALFDAAEMLAERLDEAALAPALFVRFELALLAELGFGLDLGSCAATGATEDLAYVSPRSGRAVGREPGAPYGDRLLPLPAFLASDTLVAPPPAEIAAGFRLTTHFLDAHLHGIRSARAAAERARFVAMASAPARGIGSGMVAPSISASGDSARDGHE